MRGRRERNAGSRYLSLKVSRFSSTWPSASITRITSTSSWVGLCYPPTPCQSISEPITNFFLAIDPWHPLSGGFDESPTELRERVVQFAHDHVEASRNRRHTKLCEASRRRHAVKIGVLGIAIGDMHGNRQIEI